MGCSGDGVQWDESCYGVKQGQGTSRMGAAMGQSSNGTQQGWELLWGEAGMECSGNRSCYGVKQGWGTVGWELLWGRTGMGAAMGLSSNETQQGWKLLWGRAGMGHSGDGSCYGVKQG